MAVLFPVGAVIVGCLFLLTFSERFSVSITHFTPYVKAFSYNLI